MMKDLSYFRELLLKERARLRHDLEELGHVHPDDAYDFDASAEDINTDSTDEVDRAQHIEDFSTRVTLEAELEKHYQEIRLALLAIEKGTYGICEYCKKEIPLERLEANPSARSCVLHTHTIGDASSLV